MLNSENYLDIPLFFLKFVGFQLSQKSRVEKFLMTILSFICLTCNVVFMILTGHFVLNNLDDFVEIMDSSGLFGTAIFMQIKYYGLFGQQKKYSGLVSQLKEITEKADVAHQEILKAISIKTGYITKMFEMAYINIGIFIFIKCGVLSYMKSSLQFPVPVSFYIDLHQFPIFDLVLLISFIFMWATPIGSGGHDSIMCAIGFHLMGHLQILQDKFRKQDYKNISGQELSNLVEHFNQIYECFLTFKNIFAASFFGEFVYVALTTCFMGFQVVVSDNFVVKIQCSIFVASILFQMFIYDYVGSAIASESFAISSAIYQSNWEAAPLSVKKNLLFVQQRTQKPFILRVLFYDTKLENFSGVINAAASYIALLISLL